MNKILLIALQSIVRTLIGALDYERIKLAVIRLADQEISGEEKKKIVFNEFAYVAEVSGRDLLSIAIKTAVMMARGVK
jgi:hypothetical protein